MSFGAEPDDFQSSAEQDDGGRKEEKGFVQELGLGFLGRS